ncbi:MAG: ATP-binding protein [Clostridiales bacterium]|nr:ATP-binding protein [Clostridiales bacterium]
MKRTYETLFSSELYNVKKALKEILTFLREHLPEESAAEIDDLRLIFSELLCNAVIHGNKQDLSKKVRVEVRVEEDGVSADISDEGPGFNFLLAIQNNSGIRPASLSNDHGRGIFLVHSLSDSLTFGKNGSVVQFYKRVTR